MSDERYIEVKEPEATDSPVLDKQSSAEPVRLSVPDYSYGFNQEPLESQAVRGGSTGGGSHFSYVTSHSSGDITVTGCPFTPSRVVVHGAYSTASGPCTSFGTYDGSSYTCIQAAGNGDFGTATDRIIWIQNGSGSTTKMATVSSITSDGCVITFSVSTGTFVVLVELFG